MVAVADGWKIVEWAQAAMRIEGWWTWEMILLLMRTEDCPDDILLVTQPDGIASLCNVPDGGSAAKD